MARSTLAEKTQRLNAALDLINREYPPHEAAEILVKRFRLSLRQAYRYLDEAQHLQHPMAVPIPTVPMTIKVPSDVVTKLRAYAERSGLTIGETVARAVLRFIAQARGRG
jgi:hypothetical protein